MTKNKLDYDKAIEIEKGIYWIGYNIERVYFHTNPYLIVDGDEAVLIDPGSVIDFDVILKKIKSVVDVNKVKYIILHHQDPDLCSSVKKFEGIVKDISIHIPIRSSVFLRYYGIKTFPTPVVKDGETLTLKSGRVLKFFMTPYCHSPGAMVTYDEKSKILFSSDIFGAFNIEWELYADMIGERKHLEAVKRFMEPYMGSKDAIISVVKKLEKLDIKMICPQHGSIIRKNVKKWINLLKEMNYGKAIKEGLTGLEFEFSSKK